MPSAMSRPSEPVDTVSTSIDLLFLPSRMIEPLPKLRSICESAASRAFDLSIEEPATRRRACGAIVPLLMTGIPRTDNARPALGLAPPIRPVEDIVHDLFRFAICSLSLMGYWPLSTLTGPFQIRERSLWIVTFFLGMTRKAQSAFELNTATRITHPYGLRAGVMR